MIASKQAKRGRPKLNRETVQGRLRQLGWEIPEGIKYRGADKLHTLRCIHCGHITEKFLNNVVLRGEKCPYTDTHDPVSVSIAMLRDIPRTVTGESRDLALFKEEVRTMFAEQQELILSTAMQREDVIEKFTKAFTATVSRKGYLRYGRAMNTEEWFENSDAVAMQLLERLDPQEETTIKRDYLYHRGKNSNIKPEKVLLMILNKTQLFRSLEQIQLIRILL